MVRKLTTSDALFLRTRDRLLEDLRACWQAGSNTQPFIGFRDLRAAEAAASERGYEIRQVSGRYSKDRAFVLDKTDAKSLPECWVSVEEDSYRNIFHAFLRNYVDFPKATRLPRDTDIDHALSRKRAKRIYGMSYVRLTLAEGKVNSTFGSLWERNAETNALDAQCLMMGGSGPSAGRAHFIWPLATKAFGIAAPRDPAMPESYIVDVVRQLLDLGLVEDGAMEEPFGLMVGVFRLGAKGIPEHDAQRRVRARMQTGTGSTLTEDDLLGEWLGAFAADPRL